MVWIISTTSDYPAATKSIDYQAPFIVSSHSTPYKPPMCCTLRKFPVTDFMSDHPYGGMSDRGSSSPQRRVETFPLRTALPSREPSREDIELARRILSQAQAAATNNETSRNEQPVRSSQSPSNDQQRPGSSSPNLDRARQITPRSEGEKSQSYAPVTSQPDAVPSGQVCRYVPRCEERKQFAKCAQ